MKKCIVWLIVILLTTLTLSASACGQSAAQDDENPEDAKYGGTLRMGYIADANYLHPIARISAVDNMINSWLHDSLVVIGPDGGVEPRLAREWDISDDGKTITFHLREGVTWHDDTPFTADDVIFTVHTILNPAIRSTIRPQFAALAGFDALTDPEDPAAPGDLDVAPVEKLDELTVQFNLSYPYAPFIPMALSYGLVPRHLLEEDIAAGKDLSETDYALDPVGLGPFKFVEWRRDERIIFERFEDYHGGKPYLDELVYEIIPDRTVISSSLEAGDIDFLWEAMPAAWDQLKSLDHIDYNIGEGLGFSGVFINTEQPNLGNTTVRQALRYALDMETIIKEFLGEGMTMATGPIPPSLWAYNPDIEPYDFDPERAEELFAEAGWTRDGNGPMQKDGETFSLLIETFDFARERQQACVAAQDHWSKLGLDIETQWVETTVLLDRYNQGDYEAAWVNTTGFIDPAGTLSRFESANIDAGNTTRFKNAELDGILEEAAALIKQEERKPLYQEALSILHEEQPVLWAGYLPDDFWFNKKLEGFVFTPLSTGAFTYLHEVYFAK